MRYGAASEFTPTVEIAINKIQKAHALNTARAEAARAATAAVMVGGLRASAAALLVRFAGKLLDDDARVYSRRLENRTYTETNNMKLALLVLALLLVPVVALAQASLPAELPVDQALSELLHSIGGMQGAGALGIALMVSQAVMLFFRTPLANFAGKWKFLIASGVAIVTAFLGLVAGGTNWKAALLHSAVLGSINTFAHQTIKQFTEKPAEG